ncbi:hypothetical protein [Streptomyces sp. NPDC057694]|uniref:hypothetical protein n=1 Tax=Streptomyces sp. NPDC057694 TaxID=3346216 RepID=UPI0036B68CED
MPGEEGRLSEGLASRRYKPGDRVRPKEETDHPEDPVGTVLVRISTGELSVRFPLAGVEMYLDHELDLVENAPPNWAPQTDGP